MVERLTRLISYFSAAVLVLLVVLIVYDATARYLFSTGSTALQELEWHLFDVIILFSIVFTLRENAHVRVDIFYDKFSPKGQLLVNIIGMLFFVLPLSLLITYIGFDFVTMSFLQNEASSDPGGLTHRWIVKALMPLAFVFVALQALKELSNFVKEWKKL